MNRKVSPRPARIAAVGLLLLLLSACGKPSTPEAWLAEAETQTARRDFGAAVISLKNALKLDGDNAEARFRLGRLHLLTNDGASALSELTKAQELGYPKGALYEPLARAQIADRRFDEALFDIGKALADPETGKLEAMAGKRPLQAELVALRGTAQLERVELEAAEASYKEALTLYPAHPEALVGLARLAALNGKPDEGKALLAQVKTPDPEDVMYWRVLGSLHRQAGDVAQAAASYAKAGAALAGAVQDVETHGLLSLRLGKREEAEKDLARLKERAADAPETSYLLGMLLFEQKKYEEARDAFQESVSRNDRYASPKFFLALTQLALGRLEQAETSLRDFLILVPGNPAAVKLVSSMMMKRGETAGAIEFLEDMVDPQRPDPELAALLANAYLAQGRSGQALELLERAAAAAPNSVQAKLTLGLGQLGIDQAKGLATLQSAVAQEPGERSSNALLILTQLQLGKIDDAERSAEEFVKNSPDNPFAYTLLGKVYIAKGDDARAVEALEKVRELAPGDPAASLTLALRASGRGEKDEADRLFADVLKRNPNELQALMLMAGQAINANDAAGATAALERAIKAHPKSVDPRVMLATLLLQNNKAQQAAELLADDIRAANPSHVGMWFVAGRAFLATGEYEKARDSLLTLNALQPKSVRANFYLAEAYNRLGDLDGMEKALRTVVEVKPDHAEAQINLARLLLKRGKIAEARVPYQAVLELAPADPAVATIGAALAAASGDTKTVAATYRKAFADNPNATLALGLSRAEWLLGNRQTAVEVLENWLTKHPDEDAVARDLAQAHLALGDEVKAVPLLERVLAKNPKSSDTLNSLAWALRSRDSAKALEYAERARELAPESVAILDTVAAVQLIQGDLEAAMKTNTAALRLEKDNPTLKFRRIQILVKKGMKSDAKGQLESLLAGKKAFPERADAEALAKTLW